MVFHRINNFFTNHKFILRENVMSVLSFKIPCEPGPARSVSIENWRFMRECMYYHGDAGSTLGTAIILPDRMIKIMGYTPTMIRDIILNDEVVNNAIYSTAYRLHPGWCNKCWGAGKLDWIDTAVQSPRRHPTDEHKYARHFVRERRTVLFYEDQSMVGGYDFSSLFAHVKIEDFRIETICKHCHGTGIHLDGRRTLFQGMVGLRRRLKEFKWNEKDVPVVSKIKKK